MRRVAAFGLICAFWIGTGLFGRDPWKPQEPGLVVLVAEKNGALSLPEGARPSSPAAPLYLGMAAAAARTLAPPLSQHEGARVVNILLLAAGLALTFAAAKGGAARRGWLAVLLTLGMAGFIVRAHLLNPAAAEFFGAAVALWGAMRLRRHALVGGAAAGAAAAFVFAAATPSAAFFLLAGSFAAIFAADWRRAAAGFAVALAFFIPPATWLLASGDIRFAAPTNDWTAVTDLLRLSAWALFPALPVAAGALWLRKRALAMHPAALPCIALSIAAAAHFLLFGAHEEDLFLILPPLAALAARGLEHLPDDCAAILDWFALIVVGLICVGGMWAAWAMWHGGLFPADLWAQWREQFPLLAEPPAFSGWKEPLAAAITLMWIGMAVNIGRSNERAVLNWSCGATVAWCVFNLLWLGAVDSGKSYRGMAESARPAIAGGCVSPSAAAAAAAAQLYYFGAAQRAEEYCPLMLLRAEEDPPPDFEKTWEGGRYGRKNYVLYRRLW